MTKLRNKFSYIMWGIFAVILAVLFFFAALEFLQGVAILSSSYDRVIVVLFGVILVESILIFDNLFNKSGKKREVNSKNVLGITGFLLSVTAFVGYRFLESSNILAQISEQGDLESVYSLSFIRERGIIYVNLDNVQNIFATLVSVSFKFFGNAAIGVFAAQIIISFISFLLIYFGVLRLYGRMEAFMVGMGMSFLPIFMPSGRYADYTVKVLLFALGLFLISLAKPCLIKKHGYFPVVILVPFALGFLYLYEGLCAPLIALFILFIFETDGMGIGKRFLGSFIALLLFAMGSLGVVFIQDIFSGLYGNAALNSLRDFVIYRTSGAFDASALTIFANNNFLLIVLIACITYVVTFLRCRFDEAHSMIFLFLLHIVAICFVNEENRLAYEVAGTAELLVIAGAGIKKILMSGLYAGMGEYEVGTEDTLLMPTPENKELANEEALIEAEANKEPVADSDIEILSEATPQVEEELPTVSSIIASNIGTESNQETTDESGFNMAALDWSKLREAKLIDYPENKPDESHKETEAEETEAEEAETEETEKALAAKAPKTPKTYDIDYDYEVDERDMHYDLEIDFD